VRRTLLVVLLALALPAAAASIGSGTTTRSAELRGTPALDGKLLETLPANAKVDVLKRVGGWYEVKTAAGKQGWVRMWLLRFSAPPTGASAFKQNAAVLASGRSTSTYTTATTGVRGLSEEDLQNAKPNPQAVAALEQLAVTPDDARSYAKKGSLKADPELLKEAP
jgi:uncharacterized protein YgiM (DUF1202 family)